MGRAFFGLFFALIWIQVAHASTSPAPHMLLPWGDGQSEVALQPAGLDRLAHGPSALSVSSKRLYVVDNLNERILVFTRHGELVRQISLSHAVSDLVVDVRGRLAMLDGAAERVMVMDRGGHTVYDQLLEAGSVRTLSLGPAGRPWLVLADGHAVPVGAGSDRIHAAPMGPGAPWHGAGRKISSRRGEVLLWAWGRAAHLKPLGPDRIVAVETRGDLGLVRPLGMDVHGRLYIHVETLDQRGGLKVRSEVRRLDTDGSLHRVSWTPSEFAPGVRDITLGDDGTLYRMEGTPEGLGIWRYGAGHWREVVR